MNDDEIRSELERRAGSTPTQPDWAKRALLPAVWREVDARPKPVVTSRWSTGVGVAALATALLILVVAVPRLAPQPHAATSTPTDSPTLGRDSVLSSQEFVAGMSSGSLLGQTVLVDGRIEEGVTVAVGGRPPCLPPSPCTWGSLIASPRWAIYARAVAVPEDAEGTTRDGEEWPWWGSPTLPVSGTFVLSVQDDGLVVFEGLVRPSQDGIEWSLADVAALDSMTLRPDEGLLVRGQLVTVGIDRDCHPVSPPPAGLPNRACLSTSVLVDQDPGDAGTVYVQRDAAAQFGTTEAVYAISPRLYGGYCGGPPPCWLWDVVARVDVMSATSPSPSPTSSDVSRTIGCDPGPSFVDEAGVVASCTATKSESQDELPLTVGNPGGDQSLLEITWAGGYSDLDRLVLRRGGAGYELVAHHASPINVIIDAAVFETKLRLQLSAPVSADSVSVVFEWPTSEPSPPAPTLPPVATPSLEPVTIECTDTVGLGRTMIVLDDTNLVGGCRMIRPALIQSATVTNPEGDLSRLRVEWPSSTGVEYVSVRLSRQSEGYVVEVASHDRCQPAGYVCAGLYFVGVELDLRTDVDASGVAINFFAHDGREMDIAASKDGVEFTLEIAADKTEYTQSEPIDVVAALTSDADVTVTCLSGPIISLEQLDGPITFEPGPFILLCPGSRDLRSGESIAHGFSPTAWGSAEPNPLDPYVRDGKLYLPAGTYRFHAGSSFTVGEIGGEQFRLEASIVVTVR